MTLFKYYLKYARSNCRSSVSKMNHITDCIHWISGINTHFAYTLSLVELLGFWFLPSVNTDIHRENHKWLQDGDQTMKPTRSLERYHAECHLLLNQCPSCVQHLPPGWGADRSGPASDGRSKSRCIAFLPGWWNQNATEGNQEMCALLLQENPSVCLFLKKGRAPLGKRFSILLLCRHVPQSFILFASGTHRNGCSWAAINYDTLILKQGWQIFQPTVCPTSKLPPLASVSLHTDCHSYPGSPGPYAPIIQVGSWILNPSMSCTEVGKKLKKCK